MNYEDTKAQKNLLRLERVSLAAPVGSQYLLKEISFEVFPGDRLCLIGPSGAGKTSLLRLLNRLLEPTAGTIYLENQDYRKLPVIPLRRQVMLVSQEPKLLGMTVRDALAYPLVLQGVTKQVIQQQLLKWIEQLHLPEDWLGRTEVQLSQGQRQLVGIVRALMIEPKILLFDEPTSALDAGRAAYVLQVLTQLCNEGKTTVLMVNHQLDLAQMFCNRVLYLQDGQLLEDVSAAQIDWTNLRDRFIQAEAQAAQDWG
ncbi:ATP-binding cassette domain-containing protein [Coleofasciculus sp. FACHB-64]|uniref:ABC transporter ATP-binding protein n=1 Tax=Cyanophyceae TaxID=3028117 RepID=UPI0016865CB3|nr:MULTISPECIES: ATP-binding cassette domain-containing protein [unclassified Coleofasciculus]MBD1889525.1 ATP-binding cassette domain-containing protein [Coleofasciculus sp. FACHB-SPT9]MBD2048941.1 ATP-binding cassette domain-containing protein [Coleofasciculus sp. FACHB-64]